MIGRSVLAVCLACAGCSFFIDASGLSGEAAADAGGATSAAIDAGGDARAACAGPFGAPRALDSLNSPLAEGNPRLSHDELVVVFGRPPAVGAQSDLYIATRAKIDAPFDAP